MFETDFEKRENSMFTGMYEVNRVHKTMYGNKDGIRLFVQKYSVSIMPLDIYLAFVKNKNIVKNSKDMASKFFNFVIIVITLS